MSDPIKQILDKMKEQIEQNKKTPPYVPPPMGKTQVIIIKGDKKNGK